jgi:hypothetical protein
MIKGVVLINDTNPFVCVCGKQSKGTLFASMKIPSRVSVPYERYLGWKVVMWSESRKAKRGEIDGWLPIQVAPVESLRVSLPPEAENEILGNKGPAVEWGFYCGTACRVMVSWVVYEVPCIRTFSVPMIIRLFRRQRLPLNSAIDNSVRHYYI